MTGNQLTGFIPSLLSQWSNIQTFFVYVNQLTETIPSSLSQWRKLQVFSVSFNQLTRTIPSSLSQWSNLKVLAVYNNQLTGSIPAVLGSKWSGLDAAYFDSNNFTGAVSISFCKSGESVMFLWNPRGNFLSSLRIVRSYQYHRLSDLSTIQDLSILQQKNAKRCQTPMAPLLVASKPAHQGRRHGSTIVVPAIRKQ